MKRIIASLVFVLIFTMAVPAARADALIRPPEPTIGTKSSDPNVGRVDIKLGMDESGSIMPSSTQSNLIAAAGCAVAAVGTGQANVNGYTDTLGIVESLSVTIYLQRWDGNQWVDLTSSTHTAAYTDSVFGGKNTSVTPGYYRARAVHKAVSSGIQHMVNTEGSFIWID